MTARRSLATLAALTATLSTGVAAAQASSAPAPLTPGSTLIVWADGHTHELQVVSPDGTRRSITRLTASAGLLDWSDDGTHALLGYGYGRGGKVVDLTLATGARTTIKAPNLVGASYAGGGDRDIVVSEGDYSTGTRIRPVVLRYSRSGRRLGTINHTLGGVAVNPDGTRLAQEGDGHLTISTLTGATRQVPAPGACYPLRWWDQGRILASCFKSLPHHRNIGSLQLISATTGATQRITPSNPKHVYDGNAWKVGNDTFFRAAQSCDTTSLAKMDAASAEQTVVGSGINIPLAFVGSTVIMRSDASCRADSVSLVAYDTTSGTTRTIVAPAPGVEGVTQALVLGHANG